MRRGDEMTINTQKENDTDADTVYKTSRKTSIAAKSLAAASHHSCSFGVRHFQVFLMFLASTIGFSLRVAMSVAIVPMANASTANPDIEDYGWNPEQKSLVLSSFFWGYTVTQIPSGYIAWKWSAQKLLSIGMLICGVLNMLTPVAASYGGIVAVCVCRVGMGLCQGSLIPCVQTLLAKWAPPPERARLGTFAYAGGQFGTVITMPIAGVLAASTVGWPSIFYIFGTLTIFWSIGFFFYGADSPLDYRDISEEERKFIEDSLRTTEKDQDETKQNLKIPWKEIFTSMPMWSLIIVHGGQNWGYWTLLTEMPSYMKAVLNYNIEGSGGYSALPYLAMWLLSLPASWLCDFALQKGASRAHVRKVSNTIAHWGPAIALACMSLVSKDNSDLALGLLIIAVGLNAGALCGFQINHIDLSPNYAGTMMSITNCLASIISIIGPLISGQIVVDESNVRQWNIVFYVAAIIYFVGNLVFIIYGKGEVQWWNDPEEVKARQQKQKSNIV